MLADAALSIGPFSLPVWLLFVVAGGLIGLLVQRVVAPADDVRRGGNDLLVTALLAGLIGWKIAPLLTRFEAIRANPVSLLHYPGGTLGVAMGVLAAGLVVTIRLLRSRRRHAVPAMLALAAIPVVTAALAVSVAVAIPAVPDMELQPRQAVLLDDQTVTVSPGRPTLLVFWATWCVPCGAQMPEVERAYAELDAAVYAINLTPTEPGREEILDYVEHRGLTVPVILDTGGEWSRDFAVSGTPTNMVFDAAGRLSALHVGAVSADWIRRAIGRVSGE